MDLCFCGYWLVASEKLAKNDGTMKEFFQTFDQRIEAIEKNPNTGLSTKTKEKFKKLASKVIHTPALKTSGAKAAEISEYVVVSKCYIDGHDIHFLSLSGEIISHVPMATPLSGLVARAREIISLNPQMPTRIIVLKDRLRWQCG